MFSSSYQKVDASKSVWAGHRRVEKTGTPREDDKSRSVPMKLTNKRSLQEHQGVEQTPEGEYITHIRDDKADVIPIEDGWYKIDLFTKGTVPQRTPEKGQQGQECSLPCIYACQKPRGNYQGSSWSK